MAKKTFDVLSLYAGSFFHPLPAGGAAGSGGSGGAGAGGFGGGSGGLGGSGYSGGYISGSGEVLSDFEGIIYIRYGDCEPYPVYVRPGKNLIYFFIPIILPIPVQGDFPITIESPGTLLIPAGFKIVRKAGNTLTPVPNFKIADKFGVRDFISIDLEHIEPPVNMDGIADTFTLDDFSDKDIITTTEKVLSGFDTFTLDDLLHLEYLIPIVPVNVDGITDEVVLSDSINSTLTPANMGGTSSLDTISTADFVSLDHILPTVPVTADSIKDEFAIEDAAVLSEKSTTTEDSKNTDAYTIEDTVKIEKE